MKKGQNITISKHGVILHVKRLRKLKLAVVLEDLVLVALEDLALVASEYGELDCTLLLAMIFIIGELDTV
jgi:hypothetical protein